MEAIEVTEVLEERSDKEEEGNMDKVNMDKVKHRQGG
jgi:hypothetical protein